MNILGYTTTDENGLSFELLIDGCPLGELIGAKDFAIPHWLFKDGIRELPHRGITEDRIVTVCSCGEYGCAHTNCQQLDDGDAVVLCNFDGDTSKTGTNNRFSFSRCNFESVLSEIEEKARTYRQSCGWGPSI